ncbi:MAG: hypothetical protein H6813_01135 [Phycisphaeraceae bacterium]|nr:hypothetical protein [Phycisphaeraceae bacterium]MCB9847310.1 hypothetical protein [Phycisphaeraceae bacterium]
MRLGEHIARLDRVQRSRRFRIIASVVVLVLGVVTFATWYVAVHAPSIERQTEALRLAQPPAPTAAGSAEAPGPTINAQATIRALRSTSAIGSVALGCVVGVALWELVIWLGLCLWYVALALVTAAVAIPLYFFAPTHGLGQLLIGGVALSASFSVLMRGALLALGGGGPTFAVARNVLAEAVRMKISLVFIVLLVFLLAGMPMLLDPESLLRYRVQSFLQYSISGSFWVLALLTLFFSVGTVAFEQRDRIIWQTMSKPVRPSSYLLGKWLGVVMLNLVLLTVTSTGVFLFTEHLRNQTAVGESEPFINADGSGEMTPDRMILENQVLAARRAVKPTYPPIRPEDVAAQVQERIDDLLAREPEYRQRPEAVRQVAREFENDELRSAYEQQRSIPAGGVKQFRFDNLLPARRRGERELARGVAMDHITPLVIRFKAHSVADNPQSLYRLQFFFATGSIVNETPLDVAQTIEVNPLVIDDEGSLVFNVVNGDASRNLPNQFSVRFGKDAFEALYSDGGYQTNFARVILLQWSKLAFLAAVGVAASTFLSFPIACLVAVLVLIASETGGYLAESLDFFPIRDGDEFKPVNLVIQVIAAPIARVFQPYAELKPAQNLIDGRIIPWGGMLSAASVITLCSVALLAAGWAVFRKRELALYSGH